MVTWISLALTLVILAGGMGLVVGWFRHADYAARYRAELRANRALLLPPAPPGPEWVSAERVHPWVAPLQPPMLPPFAQPQVVYVLVPRGGVPVMDGRVVRELPGRAW